MKYRTAFSVTGRIAPAPKFRLGLADCELRSWNVLLLHRTSSRASNWSLMINPVIRQEKSMTREDVHFDLPLRQYRRNFLDYTLHHVRVG